MIMIDAYVNEHNKGCKNKDGAQKGSYYINTLSNNTYAWSKQCSTPLTTSNSCGDLPLSVNADLDTSSWSLPSDQSTYNMTGYTATGYDLNNGTNRPDICLI